MDILRFVTFVGLVLMVPVLIAIIVKMRRLVDKLVKHRQELELATKRMDQKCKELRSLLALLERRDKK
jgi:hypothetical protein